MAVQITRKGDVAIVSIDNPPVNAIGHAVRAGLLEAVETLSADGTLKAVVLTGAGKIFAAGADAREFDTPPESPHLPDVALAIETAPQPWIAAINGAALGGGCELALACRMRIAGTNATIGLPEVTLGVVPGAGGTQRLPRLVGLKSALDIIPQGKVLKADAAKAVGLIDRIADDPVAEAMALVDGGKLGFGARLSERAAVEADATAVLDARSRAAKRMRGQIAPERAIDLLERATQEDFDRGMAQERETFLELRQGEQAKALRHIFFAERGAKKPDSIAAEPVPVDTVVVIGGGTMGAGIAYALERAGYTVTLVETDEGARERAEANVGRLFKDAVKRGLMAQEEADERQARITLVVGYDDLPPAGLAIEAAFESIEVKREIFGKLDEALPKHAILATNTSYLDVNEIAASTSRPERVLGLHFFSPAHIMKLLEIVRADKTSHEALATGFAVGAKLKKIPVLAGVCDGFIGNRILFRYREEADVLMMDGSLPWLIDEAMVEFGMAMGPYEVQDLSGLDISYAQRKRRAPTRDPNRRYIPIADRMVEEGRIGKKASVGWYRYPGGGGAVVDPLLEDLITEEAHFAKVTRREISPDEIRERLTLAMINEAADILNDGIAQKASDIDLVMVHGYGFPRWRGGPMHYADTIGAAAILDKIRAFERDDPVMWRPSPLIVNLAASGGRFANAGQV
ncbi:FAD-dependent oxidoreductase [Pararhizobium haloflavum]|uniref:FAD-dependent oxidoreductase n=1 Tax=Pararhizobium haloflavum TaxID=2037914 RepID=UPI000C194EDC|nr:FAD-dependent oxidoreductase [Pararhizobium haloflavum]